MTADHIDLRNVFPSTWDQSRYLAVLDQNALTPFASVGGKIPGVTPFAFGLGHFDLHWNLFRVSSPPRYVIFGLESRGWLGRKSRLRVFEPVPGRRLVLHIEIPGSIPYHFPLTVTASMNGRPVTHLVVTKPGVETLQLPLDTDRDIEIEADGCSTPEQCYLLDSASEQ